MRIPRDHNRRRPSTAIGTDAASAAGVYADSSIHANAAATVTSVAGANSQRVGVTTKLRGRSKAFLLLLWKSFSMIRGDLSRL